MRNLWEFVKGQESLLLFLDGNCRAMCVTLTVCWRLVSILIISAINELEWKTKQWQQLVKILRIQV